MVDLLDPVVDSLDLKFGRVDKQLRKDSRSIKNRVQSILYDAKFVQQVQKSYNLPLVANERCGRWYIDPKNLCETVYFKSTDGHTGQWGFSTRRLNSHIISTIVENNGVIIVDSTRRGKRMPDALSKTVPIWCAVVNAVMFGGQKCGRRRSGGSDQSNDSSDEADSSKSSIDGDDDIDSAQIALDEGITDPVSFIFVPPNAVSPSEASQIRSRLPEWVKLFKSSGFDIDSIKRTLDKPLRPLWVTPDVYDAGYLPETPPQYEDFYPVVLCTASRMVQDGTEFRSGYTYVQGAADDHEGWAGPLTADMLWSHVDYLGNRELSDGQLHEYISNVSRTEKAGDSSEAAGNKPTQILPTGFFIGKGRQRSEFQSGYNVIIDLCSDAIPMIDSSSACQFMASLPVKYLHIPIASGKKGSKQLRTALPTIADWFESIPDQSKDRILVSCDTGSDLAVAVTLMLMCLFWTGPPSSPSPSPLSTQLSKHRTKTNLNKHSIRSKLIVILSQLKANPGRATLTAVNSFLMG